MTNESASRAKASEERQAQQRVATARGTLALIIQNIDSGDICDINITSMVNEILLRNDGPGDTALKAPSGTLTFVIQARSREMMATAEEAARLWVEQNPRSGIIAAPADVVLPPPPGTR